MDTSTIKTAAALTVFVLSLSGCGHRSWKPDFWPIRGKEARSEQGREPGYREDCSATREYVATLAYLRENSDLSGNEPQARKIADDVSKACTGAARRFINVARLLRAVDLDNKVVVDLGLEAARGDDDTASAFLSIFQKLYLKSYLDLDVGTALRISKSLSLEFKGNPRFAERDFSHFVKFCRDEPSLGLSQMQCAEFGARVAGHGARDRREVFSDFKSVYRFLMNDILVQPDIPEGLRIAENVVRIGPRAAENFKQAFKFAMAKGGLELKGNKPLQFALEMASRSKRTTD